MVFHLRIYHGGEHGGVFQEIPLCNMIWLFKSDLKHFRACSIEAVFALLGEKA
jgi:hypothetical protein